MAQNILFSPPVAFAAFLLLSLWTMRALARYERKGDDDARALDPYACGQDKDTVRQFVAPNYKRTFYLAFFFTVMHVLVMIVATAPAGHTLLPVAYIGVGVLAMLILFRK